MQVNGRCSKGGQVVNVWHKASYMRARRETHSLGSSPGEIGPWGPEDGITTLRPV